MSTPPWEWRLHETVMNFSLLLIGLMVLVVIPLLIRTIFVKLSAENVSISSAKISKISEFQPEVKKIQKISKISKVSKVSQAILLDIPMAASTLLPMPENPTDVKHKNIQKELFAEKIVYITALQNHFFRGYSLLQGLQNAGFTYGKKELFYYVTAEHIICSAAPVTAPYVFNMIEIGALATPAVRISINPAVDEQHAQSIIHRLAEELGGEVQDESSYCPPYL